MKENIFIRNMCNQMCLHCLNPMILKEGKANKTTHEEILERIRTAASSDYVCFTGEGEPTMEKRLPEYIRYAKQLGIKKIGVESNGMMFHYSEYVKRLKDAGLDSCIFTLFSHHPKIHDKITQVPGSFMWTIKGLENLKENDIEITCILHTINSLNYGGIKDFTEFMHEKHGISEFGLSFIRPNDNSVNITPRLSQVKAHLHEALNYCKVNAITVMISANYGVPACFLDGYEEYSDELRLSKTMNQDEFEKMTHNAEKIKDDKCKECIYDRRCSGVPRTYAEIYGTGELEPKIR